MIPLNVKTHYSLLFSSTKIDKLVEKCVEYGYKSCAITDLNSISGAVEFTKACKEKDIKPIFGVDLTIADDNSNRVILAKNLDGWKSLIKLVSKHNTDKVNYSDVLEHGDNLIFLTKDIPECLYLNQEDVEDQRLLLCSKLKATSKSVWREIVKLEHASLLQYFQNDNFFLQNSQEKDKSDEIADQCENYNILSKPVLPKFECPDGLSEDDYLRKLCEAGLLKTFRYHLDEQIYRDRMNFELGVFKEAGLAGYFLIVQDYVNWAKNQGWLVGPGRGSVGGSLVAYLTGIITINPIQYGLLFARFYNSGRNVSDSISFLEFPLEKFENGV